MKALKSIFYIFICIISFLTVNSIGVYEGSSNSQYVIYSNNLNPTITINITNPTGPIYVKEITLRLNSNNFSTISINDYLEANSKNNIYKFEYNEFNLTTLKNEDFLEIEILVLDSENKAIQTLSNSDPTFFKVIIDNTKPTILSVFPLFANKIKVSNKTKKINIVFSEKIKSYKIISKGTVISSFTNSAPVKNLYFDSLLYNIPDNLNLDKNITNITLKYEDLAGNWNQANYTLVVVGVPLKITLLTRKEDFNLSYFYNSSLPHLFGTTIYSNKKNFNLNIKTSQPSKCYYANNLFEFKLLTNNFPKKIAISNDANLMHSIAINLNLESNLWLACQKIIDPEDVTYLGDSLFNLRELVKVKFYDETLILDSIIPSSIITNNLFDLSLRTSQNSICYYGLDSNATKLFNNSNLKKHTKLNENLNREGKHKLNVGCLDVLGDLTTKSKNILLNTTLGVKIISFNPKYITSTNTVINYRLSTPADCRVVIPKNKIIKDSTSFNKLLKSSQVINSNLDYSTSLSSLSTGENIITFSCLKNGQLFNGEKIKIIYDPNGPSLSNLEFLNNGKKSDYLGSFDKLEYRVKVNSISSVNKFFIEISTTNKTLNFEKSRASSILSGEFEGATKIKIIGQNLLKINSSSIEKTIKFDLNPPQISFVKQGDSVKINCFDSENECQDIKYGFSYTAISCNPSLKYKGIAVKITDNNYVCALAKDLVGHLAREQFQLVEGFDNNDFSSNSNDDNSVLNNDNKDSNNASSENISSNNNIDDDSNNNDNNYDPSNDSPFNPQDFQTPKDNTTTYSIIAALVTLLGSLGGGGFYAYKKGYLNKHLEKFGFKNKSNQNLNTGKNIISENNINSNSNKTLKDKGTYKDHYKKLNSFLDKTLEKKSGVFKDFEKNNKGKVEGYEDTLIKTKKSAVSKEDFDEFYSSSTQNQEIKSSKSLEKDAEDFEDYHKNKKQNNKKKD